MVLTDGTGVLFVSCHTCEQREWLQSQPDGAWEAMPIGAVIERSAKTKKP